MVKSDDLHILGVATTLPSHVIRDVDSGHDMLILLRTDHFSRYAPEHIEYGINRYQNETRRLYSVLDKHLSSDNRPYLCGEKCTIAGSYYPSFSCKPENHDMNAAPSMSTQAGYKQA